MDKKKDLSKKEAIKYGYEGLLFIILIISIFLLTILSKIGLEIDFKKIFKLGFWILILIFIIYLLSPKKNPNEKTKEK